MHSLSIFILFWTSLLTDSFPQDAALLGFQVVFDLYENERQAFLLRVKDLLPEPKVTTDPEAPQGAMGAEQTAENGSTVPEQVPTSMDTTEETANEASGVSTVMHHGKSSSHDEVSVKYAERLAKLKKVLSGETPIHLTLQFLYGHNRYEPTISNAVMEISLCFLNSCVFIAGLIF